MRKAMVITAVLGALLSGQAPHRAYIRNVEILALVAPSGSLTVAERITVEPLATSARIEYPQPGGWAYSDWTLMDAATASPVDGHLTSPTIIRTKRDRIVAGWRFAPSESQRTFDVTYRVEGAVIRHLDVAELRWERFMVSEQEMGVARIQLSLPSPGGSRPNVRAWAHGSIDQEIGQQSKRDIVAHVATIPAGQHLGVRVILPRRLVPRAREISDRVRPGIIATEEHGVASAASRLRRAETDMAHATSVTLLVIIGIALIAGVSAIPRLRGPLASLINFGVGSGAAVFGWRSFATSGLPAGLLLM
ncbi:MAG TPA: DUF2207 domain-containing protein, partial [Actinomycetota bacterium]|nr:DUF2207 domain-containing protein [Actinomycetota bacterium]